MNVGKKFQELQGRIARACKRAHRKPDEVKLLGVCKRQPMERILEGYRAGLRLFGENRVQEAEEHRQQLNHPDIEWHFVGKIQKNKINKILNHFDFVQSVAGVKTLEHINKRLDEPRSFFLEINIGNEPTKAGFSPEGVIKALPYISTMTRVRVSGLMTIPPYFDDPEQVRPFFKRMRQLGEEINQLQVPNVRVEELSMGMSDDFEIAIEEGATILRIGTALFGRRPA